MPVLSVRAVAWAVTACLAAGAAGAGALLLAPAAPGPVVAGQRQAPVPTPPSAHEVLAAVGAATPARSAAPDVPVRLRVDAVGIDLAVRPVAATGGRLDPPTTTDAYWIEAYGRPSAVGTDPAGNTVYLAAHSSNRDDAAFNSLLDVDARRARVAPGDRIEVDTARGTGVYVMDGTDRYPKGALAGAQDVWRAVPDRLVLITCFQRVRGRSLDNLVVSAHAVGWRPAA